MLRAFLVPLALILFTTLPVEASHKLDPGTANLSLADLPAGFTMSENKLLKIKAAAKDAHRTEAELTRQGRVLTRYRVFNRSALVGLVEIISEVVQCRSDKLAWEDFARFTPNWTKNLPKDETIKPMSSPTVGLQTEAWLLTSALKGGVHVQMSLLAFRYGSYD